MSDQFHRDKLLVEGETPQPGSHLITPRRGYTHHGIYVGDGKVVHYSGLARGQFRGRIEEVSLAQFAYGRSVWTRSSDLPEFAPQEVIRRARSRVGENRYRILRNNCEHFCEWCLHGESRSYQVERFLSFRPALGMMLGDHLTPAVIISMNTGLRRGELLKLRWRSIDFNRRLLTVEGPTAKSRQTRHVPLNEEAINALRHWRQHRHRCPRL